MFDPRKPYNDLPLLPPAADVEPRPILKRCIAAHAALAELRQAGDLIPNQAALINSIPLLEARDSSEIENIVTTNDALFRHAALDEPSADPHTKEALLYRTALYKGYLSIRDRPLSTRTAVDICRTLKGIELDVRRTPGTKLTNKSTGEVIYTPPEGEERLRHLLANWERFLHQQTDIDPLIRMAVMHYQFEAIHPFTDGNGRTGRVLNVLFLIEEGILDLPTLYLSRYILRRRSDYYRLLLNVTSRQDWLPWIDYMLTGLEETARWTTKKIRAIRQLMEHTNVYVKSVAPGSYSYDLIQLIFTFPYCRISNVVEARILARHRAGFHLRELARVGVLQEIKVGRKKLFLHPKFLALLTSEGHEFEPYIPHAGAEEQPAAGKLASA
jgi:Fic family protein